MKGYKKNNVQKVTRAEEFLGLSALHGPFLLKLQHRRPEDPLDLLRHVPPGLVVLRLGCAARLHLSGAGGQREDSLSLQFRARTQCALRDSDIFMFFNLSQTE